MSSSDDPILAPRDALHIPVIVRGAPGKRQYPKWRRATEPWPTTGEVPGNGEYLADTTWREVLNAAITVGRDLAPWLIDRRHRAVHELLARVTPLTAYLSREHCRLPHGERPRLVPSVAYSQGAERSAQGAFAYRLGMTMAEWACRGLMGLGPTFHTESTAPTGSIDWPTVGSTPDLFGHHSGEQRLWLVESKAARSIGLSQLKRGRDQLLAGGAYLKNVPHRLVLCGSSVEEEVFVTVDTIATGGPDSWPEHLSPGLPPAPGPMGGEDSMDLVTLTELARSQMLVYFFLSSVESDQRTVIPAALHRPSTAQRSYGSLSLLEHDPSTRRLRGGLRQEPPVDTRDLMGRENMEDLLTAPLPGAGIRVGLSRGLFSACDRLRQELENIVEETRDSEPVEPNIARSPLQPDLEPSRLAGRTRGIPIRVAESYDSVDRRAELSMWARRAHALERARADELRQVVREGYAVGQGRSWRDLLDDEPTLAIDGGGSLEAVGRGTYIAIDEQTPVLDPRGD
ncbi:hypothetical protein ACFV4I_12840 [Nocardiopsis alba]|uniref:hypothetical protein n=1 Tax=Nocardiopsis alba TaxID=53437 RepID=UPI00364ABFBA